MRLAVIPGDGIGPEVVAEGLKVLAAVLAPTGRKVQTTTYDLGARRWHATGETLPDSVLAELREHDAILLGAVGDPGVPSGVLERGLLLRLRFALDHAVNLRPVRRYDDDSVDLVVVREGTEGLYAGAGGTLRPGTAHEVATEESLNTAYGVERVARYGFAAARARRGRLTLVHKTNVLVHAGALWRRVVEQVAAEHPEVAVDYAHVDAAAMYLVQDAARFDVVVTDNLFGDILTDLGAAVAGGIGLAASGNINVSGSAPSMFEPVHGSAPDIAGRGVADPTATVLSVAMLLEHLGHADAARRVEDAVRRRQQRRPAPARTAEVGDELAALVTS
jgi:3-isopropylmalate dehydrogenase